MYPLNKPKKDLLTQTVLTLNVIKKLVYKIKINWNFYSKFSLNKVSKMSDWICAINNVKGYQSLKKLSEYLWANLMTGS